MKNTLYILLSSTLAMGVFFIFPQSIFAMTCASQTAAGAFNQGFGNGSNYAVGTPFTVSGDCYITDISGKLGVNAGSPTDGVLLQIYSDSGGSPGVELDTTGPISVPSTNVYNAASTVGYHLVSGTTYWFVPLRSGAQDGSNYYTTNLNHDFVTGSKQYNGSSWSSLSGYAQYYVVNGNSTPPPPSNTATRIISFNSPVSNQTTVSTSVTFDFDWYNGSPNYSGFVGVELNDLTAAQQLIVPEHAINLSGTGNYTEVFTGLTSGHAYLVTPYMRDAVFPRITGTPIFFSAVSHAPYSAATSTPPFGLGNTATTSSGFSLFDNGSTTPGIIGAGIDAFATCGVFSALTLGLCPAIVFLAVPNGSSFQSWQNLGSELPQRVPFSYMYGVADGFNGITQSADASSSPTVNIDFTGMTCSGSWSGSGAFTCNSGIKTWLPTNLLLFSTTSMATFIPYSVVSFGRSAMEIALFFAFGLFIFYRVTRFFNNKTA